MKDLFNIYEVAEILGIGIKRTRVIVSEALKRKLIAKPKLDGVRLVYSQASIDKLKDLYGAGEFGRPRRSKRQKSSGAVYRIEFKDPEVVEVLRTIFGSDQKIAEYVNEQLRQVAEPAIKKLKKLEEEYEQEKRKLLQLK